MSVSVSVAMELWVSVSVAMELWVSVSVSTELSGSVTASSELVPIFEDVFAVGLLVAGSLVPVLFETVSFAAGLLEVVVLALGNA